MIYDGTSSNIYEILGTVETKYEKRSIKELINRGEVTKDDKFVILTSEKDAEAPPVKVEIGIKNEKLYFICPRCAVIIRAQKEQEEQEDSQHIQHKKLTEHRKVLYYPLNIISREDRQWLCNDCIKEHELSGSLTCFKNRITGEVGVNLTPMRRYYPRQGVHSDSFGQIAFCIDKLFETLNLELTEEQMKILLGRKEQDVSRVKRGKSKREEAVKEDLTPDFKAELMETVREEGSDKEYTILWNYFYYRDAIISGRIKYYSSVAKFARNKYRDVFTYTLSYACDLYKDRKHDKKKDRENKGIKPRGRPSEKMKSLELSDVQYFNSRYKDIEYVAIYFIEKEKERKKVEPIEL